MELSRHVLTPVGVTYLSHIRASALVHGWPYYKHVTPTGVKIDSYATYPSF